MYCWKWNRKRAGKIGELNQLWKPFSKDLRGIAFFAHRKTHEEIKMGRLFRIMIFTEYIYMNIYALMNKFMCECIAA